MTVRAFAADFLKGAASRVKPATLNSYTWALDKHVVPAPGDLRVAQLSRSHAKALATSVLATLSRKSAAIILGTLHTMLEDAVEDGIVVTNEAAVLDVEPSSYALFFTRR